MGGVGGEAIVENIIYEIKLLGFEGLVYSEAVVDQYPWLLVSLFSSLGVEHVFELLQANLRVSIPRDGTRIVLPRGRKHSLVTSISNS